MHKKIIRFFRKYQIIGKNPDIFNLVDQWVLDVSVKRYKSLKRIVKILVDQIEDEESYEGKEDLIKIRAFYRWVTANIRWGSIFWHYITQDVLIKKDYFLSWILLSIYFVKSLQLNCLAGVLGAWKSRYYFGKNNSKRQIRTYLDIWIKKNNLFTPCHKLPI